jgi:hypothetical protein
MFAGYTCRRAHQQDGTPRSEGILHGSDSIPVLAHHICSRAACAAQEPYGTFGRAPLVQAFHAHSTLIDIVDGYGETALHKIKL